MRVRFAFLIAAWLAVGAASAANLETGLAGDWRSDKLTMVIDPFRGQARLNPEKPFQWERFIIKSTAGSQVVFTIGVRLFVATLEGNTLAVEAPGFSGVQTLRRAPPPKPEAEPPPRPAVESDPASFQLRGTDSSGLVQSTTPN